MENSELQTLLDRIAIEEVRHHYSQALDYQDWDRLLSFFKENIKVDFSDFGMPPQIVSKTEFVESFQHNLSRSGLKTQHIFTSFRIVVAGDQGTSVSNFVGYHFLAGEEGGEEFTLHGEYTDTLTKTSGRWQISGTACKLLYMTGNPKLLAD